MVSWQQKGSYEKFTLLRYSFFPGVEWFIIFGVSSYQKHFLSAYLKAIKDCVCPLEAKNLIHKAN